MKATLTLLFLAVAGCSSAAPKTPDSVTEASVEEQKLDPHKAGRQLIDTRETEGHLDRAVRVLEYHATQKPQDAKLQVLAAEAYSRSLEDMGDRKKTDTARAKRLLTQGSAHAKAAVDLEPADATALYWQACLMLHQADVDKSLGTANKALALLEKADAADPKIDDGGPSRMKGRVYYEMPPLVGGSVSKAIANYKRSISFAPTMTTTHLWLGEAYEYAKHPDLARKEWETVVATKPRPGREKEDGADIKAAQEKLQKLK